VRTAFSNAGVGSASVKSGSEVGRPAANPPLIDSYYAVKGVLRAQRKHSVSTLSDSIRRKRDLLLPCEQASLFLVAGHGFKRTIADGKALLSNVQGQVLTHHCQTHQTDSRQGRSS
jgi:hypothetical protein